MTLRICLWSGPRNVSTAVMYAFRQRPDTTVVDEPLYGHYLATSGTRHPGSDDVMAAMDVDGERVVREVVLGPWPTPVVFFKLMAHHLAGLDRGFLEDVANVILTRHPRDMLPSLTVQLPDADLDATSLPMQAAILDATFAAGREPLVLEARRLLDDPAGVLAETCRRLGIEFTEAMLSWPAGPKPEDGVWAPHWYHNVHQTTGFVPYQPKVAPFPARLEPLLAECMPFYDRLEAHAIGKAP